MILNVILSEAKDRCIGQEMHGALSALKAPSG